MILSILLTILKIIGIFLASIFGLILLLLLLVLFVPIRYKASALRTGEDDDPPVIARAKVSWLLHIFSVNVMYPNEKIVTVRIFGIPIMKIPKDELSEEEIWRAEQKRQAKEDKKRKKEEKKKQKSDNKTSDKKKSENENPLNSGESSSKEEQSFLDKDGEKNSNDVDSASADSLDTDFSKSTDPGNLDDETENIKKKKKSIFSRFFDAINNIKYTIKRIYANIKKGIEDKKKINDEIKKNIHYYHQILTSDLFEITFDKTKEKIFKLLKSILPRKWDINLEVGFDDPYTTGEVLAISGMLHPIIWEHVHVIGNFEEPIIRGAGKLKGRIYIFSFLKILIYYLTDKDLKRLIRLFKKEEHKRGRK